MSPENLLLFAAGVFLIATTILNEHLRRALKEAKSDADLYKRLYNDAEKDVKYLLERKDELSDENQKLRNQLEERES